MIDKIKKGKRIRFTKMKLIHILTFFNKLGENSTSVRGKSLA